MRCKIWFKTYFRVGEISIIFFSEKYKVWEIKTQILVENRNLTKNLILAYKVKFYKPQFWSIIEVLVKHRNFGQKSKSWLRIEVWDNNLNFGPKSIFLEKCKQKK